MIRKTFTGHFVLQMWYKSRVVSRKSGRMWILLQYTRLPVGPLNMIGRIFGGKNLPLWQIIIAVRVVPRRKFMIGSNLSYDWGHIARVRARHKRCRLLCRAGKFVIRRQILFAAAANIRPIIFRGPTGSRVTLLRCKISVPQRRAREIAHHRNYRILLRYLLVTSLRAVSNSRLVQKPKK